MFIKEKKRTVFKFNNLYFKEYAKPIITSWLYMAKQFAYLKSLVYELR